MLSTRPMAWVNERSTALDVYGTNICSLLTERFPRFADISVTGTQPPRRRSSTRPRPTSRTFNCVVLSTILLLIAFGTQYFIIESMQTTTLAATVIMNLGLSVTVFALILLIAKQPQVRNALFKGAITVVRD